jgi:hypothetical protein
MMCVTLSDVSGPHHLVSGLEVALSYIFIAAGPGMAEYLGRFTSNRRFRTRTIGAAGEDKMIFARAFAAALLAACTLATGAASA